MTTYNPWAVISQVRDQLAADGIRADNQPGGDALAAAENLLLALGIFPQVPEPEDDD